MNVRHLHLFAFSLFLISSVSLSAQDQFEQTAGPYGGNIFSAAVAADGTVYVVTGNNEVVRSENNGASWVRCEPRGVHRVAVDSSGNVYAGFDFGVYHSSDRGRTWKRHEAGTPVPSLNSFTQVYLLEAGTNGTVYLGYDSLLYRSTNMGASWSEVVVRQDKPLVRDISVGAGGVLLAGISGGIYSSSDAGTTWSRKNLPMTSSDTAIVVTSTAGGEIWVRVAPQLELYHSTDGGTTWTAKGSFGLPSNTTMHDLTLSPGGVLFAGMQTGLYRSTNKGENWQATGGEGIERNVVPAVVTSGDGTVFAGASDLYRSVDGGNVWNPSTAGMIATAVFALEEGIGNRIFAGTINNLFRSDDGGSHWNESGAGIPENTRITDLLRGGGVMLATTRGGGIYRSTNNGDSWVSANLGLSSSVANRVIVADNGSLLAATNDGVFRSTNEGSTWVPSSTGLPGQAIRDISNAGGGEIFAATQGSGIFASSDHGATWQARNSGITDPMVNAIIATPRGTIFAGTEHDGIFRSVDRGSNWTQVTFDVATSHVAELALDHAGSIYIATHFPVRSSDNGNTWSEHIHIPFLNNTHTRSHLAASNGTFFFGTDGAGVARLVPDQGGRWELIGSAPAGTRIVVSSTAPSALVGPTSFAFEAAPLYAATADGVFQSIDEGLTWSLISEDAGLIDIAAVADYRNGESLFVARAGGVSVYTPETGLWTDRSVGLPAGGVAAFAVDNPFEKIYAATGRGVFVTSGGAWSPAREGMGEKEITDLLLAHDGGLLAVDATGALYRAATAGGSWNTVNGTTGRVLSLAADPSGRIYAGTEQGRMYRSNNNGIDWQEVDAGMQGKSIVSLAISSHGTIVAGTTEGLRRSIDGGALWSDVESAGPVDVRQVMVAGNGRMFLATSSGSLLRSIGGNGTSSVPAIETATRTVELRITGNGVPGQSQLHYSLPAPADLTIDLFDAQGERVRRLVDRYSPAGEQSIRIETEELPTGTYFCRLVAGETIVSSPLFVVR